MTRWTIDPSHSQIGFSVKHMMVSTVRGRFTDFAGEIEFDEAQPEHSRVDVSIDAASIDTGADQRDAHLRSADFFDADTYPDLTFTSTAVEPAGSGYRIAGDLAIRGEARPVTLEAKFQGIVPGMQGGRRAAFSASTRISRKSWGLTWNVALETGGWLVGDEIRIDIDVAAVEVAPAVAATAA